MVKIKILSIISSGRKNGHTSKVISILEEEINRIAEKTNENLQFEILHLVDYQIEHCRGCRACMDYGDKKCPLKDDISLIKAKIKESDLIIFASPVYLGDVNSMMKALIDRLAYMCHRQEFYDKCATIIVTTNSTSLKRTIRTIGSATYSWGFKTIGTKGFKTSSSNDSLEVIKQKYVNDIAKLGKKIYSAVKGKSYLNPSILSLAMFKIQQKSRSNPEISSVSDFNYWRENGWIENNKMYYFDVKISLLKKILSRMLYGLFSIIFNN